MTKKNVYFHSFCIIMIFVLSFFPFSLRAQEEKFLAMEEFHSANEYYRKEQYEQAAKKYLKIIQQGYQDPSLFYNLGNAYFKAGEDGTAIGLALTNCVNRLKDIKAKSKIIILLTDGQNNRGEIDPITAAKVAKTMGIKIYAVGVGKEGGAPIPTYDPFFGKIYARGPDGRLLLTRMDEATLKEIARITEGEYFRATDPDSLEEIYQQIDRLEKTKIEIKQFTEYSELFHYFLITAIAFLVLGIILENTRFRTIP